jgi:hypothetical protein
MADLRDHDAAISVITMAGIRTWSSVGSDDPETLVIVRADSTSSSPAVTRS